jgi:hypothetical protein
MLPSWGCPARNSTGSTPLSRGGSVPAPLKSVGVSLGSMPHC